MPGTVPILCLALVVPAAVHSEPRPTAITLGCAAPHVSVVAADLPLAQRLCRIADAAAVTFGDLGLGLNGAVTVSVVPELDAPKGCVAMYHALDSSIEILAPDCLDRDPGRLSLFPDVAIEPMFESLVVHELTHAYVEHTAGNRFVPRIAHEYLAYALQLAALPADARDRIVDAAAPEGRVVFSGIDEALLSFAPARFAALSWLDFSTREDPRAFVSGILSGDVTFHSLRE